MSKAPPAGFVPDWTAYSSEQRQFPPVMPLYTEHQDGSPKRLEAFLADQCQCAAVLDSNGQNGWVQIGLVIGDGALYTGMDPDIAEQFANELLKTVAELRKGPDTSTFFRPCDIEEQDDE